MHQIHFFNYDGMDLHKNYDSAFPVFGTDDIKMLNLADKQTVYALSKTVLLNKVHSIIT